MSFRNAQLTQIRTIADFRNFHRVVKEIYMDRDPRRDPRERPLAADIFLSLWHSFLGQPIQSLRKIYFETVTENTLDSARRDIYEEMDVNLSDQLGLSCRSQDQTEQRAFHKTYNKTPFGKCAKTIVTQNQDMKRAGVKVYRFEFIPAEPSGFYFHFSVEFRAHSTQHYHHGGHHHRRGHGRRH